MKRRKFLTVLSIALMSMVLVCASVIIATQAWFYIAATHMPTWKSSSQGAYFAYGNGKIRNDDNDDSPYGITKPIHLYNLAWLQYLGFFDINEVSDSYNLDNVYFELAADIDMTGWTLPPIGTKEHPFVGNFNGNGYKITGLTVSNDLDDYNRIPFGIKRNDFPNEINVLGLFGVVGKFESNTIATYNTSANQILNTGISSLTVKSKITSTDYGQLVGLAAGYVNGQLSGVAVNDSSLDLSSCNGKHINGLSNNISDYSLVGHVKDESYLSKLQVSTTTQNMPTITNPFLSQGGNSWGGSIEMDTLYNRLFSKFSNNSNYSYTYTTKEEQTRRDNGDGTYTPTTGYTPEPEKATTATQNYGTYRVGSGSNATTMYLFKHVDTGTRLDGTPVQTASYSFANDDNSPSDEEYAGLSGSRNMGSYTYTLRSNTVENKSGFKIYDSTTNTYLSTNGTSLIDSDESNAPFWIFDNSGYVYTNVNNINYYLNHTGATIQLSQSGSSTWTWDETSETIKSTDNYYLIYDSTWKLSSSYTYYIIHSGDNYLGLNDAHNDIAIVNSQNASKWYVETGNTPYLYTYYNNQKQYIEITRESAGGCGGGYNYDHTLSTSKGGTRIQKSNNTLYCSSYNGYLVLGNSITYSTNSTNVTYNASALNCSRTAITNDITTYSDSTSTRNITSPETYFPLTYAKDSDVNPSPSNTGYIISGKDYENESKPSIGDIRVASAYKTSKFATTNAMTDGSSTYDNTKLYAWTYDSTKTLVKIGDPINGKENTSGYSSYSSLGLEKYFFKRLGKNSGARTALGEMLGASGNTNKAYGLHFMNCTISTSNKITVPYALINQVEYTNYELPRDAIDFNLKTAGSINFFAATYFCNTSSSSYNGTDKTQVNFNNSNNSFFSLHIIDRGSNPLTIDSIKEIDKIYTNASYNEADPSSPKYVYSYRGQSSDYVDTGIRNSSGNLILGSKGTQLFDTYWLTDPDYNDFYVNALYYFEIPVNKGEFALGSTSGKTSSTYHWTTQYNKNGAYLLYLDIGASAKNTNGITIDDISVTTINKYLYPHGIDFSVISTQGTGNYTSILGGDTAAITVPTGTTQILSYSYTPGTSGTTVKPVLSVTPNSGENSCTAVYKTVGITINNGSGGSIPIAEASSSTHNWMKREIFYDFRDYVSGASITPIISVTRFDANNNQIGDIQSDYGTALTFTDDVINSIVSFEPEEDIVLYVVDFSNRINDEETDTVFVDSTYTHYDVQNNNVQEIRAFTITLKTTEQGKKTQLVLTNLDNLEQTIEGENITHTLSLLNYNEENAAIGTITTSDEGKFYIVICMVS